MKERPIIFSAPMVRAILEGRKTMTRRIVKPGKLYGKTKNNPEDIADVADFSIHPPSIYNETGYYFDLGDNVKILQCPYGTVGDRLWVRETWRVGAWNEDEGSLAIDYRADNYSRREWIKVQDEDMDGRAFQRLWEQSTGDASDRFGYKEKYRWNPGESPCRWRSPLHMRREFSRITLEITNIRVERLQSIMYEDAVKEGIYWSNAFDGYVTDGDGRNFHGAFATHSFMSLWQSINGTESLETNPWVWVVEFRRINL